MDIRQMQKVVYQNKVDHGFDVTGVDLQQDVERKMEINRRRQYGMADGVFRRISEE